jgi:hypothetical protein
MAASILATGVHEGRVRSRRPGACFPRPLAGHEHVCTKDLVDAGADAIAVCPLALAEGR